MPPPPQGPSTATTPTGGPALRHATVLILAAVAIAAAVASLLAGATGAAPGGLGVPLLAAAGACGLAGYAAGRGLLVRARPGLAAMVGGMLMAAAIGLGLWAMVDPDPWRGFVVYAVMLASLAPAMVGLAIAAWRHLYGDRA